MEKSLNKNEVRHFKKNQYIKSNTDKDINAQQINPEIHEG